MGVILIPVDFSTTSKKALHYAAKIAQATSKPLKVVHFFDTVVPYGVAYPPSSFIEKASEESLTEISLELKEFTKEISQLKYKELDQELHIHLEVIKGDPIFQTEELCKEGKVDLIVMGTEGSEGFGRWLIGTHTSNVVKKAKCPVFVIPDEAKYRPIKKIAYATDFKTLKDEVVDNLMEWVKRFGAEFHFIHIAHKGEYIDVDEYQNLEEIVDMSKKYDNIKFKIIYDNDILDELEDFAEDNNIDILMMVKRKLSFFQRIFEPSLTQQMTFETEVPLLIFHQ